MKLKPSNTSHVVVNLVKAVTTWQVYLETHQYLKKLLITCQAYFKQLLFEQIHLYIILIFWIAISFTGTGYVCLC